MRAPARPWFGGPAAVSDYPAVPSDVPCLQDQLLSKATDVYSFGCLCWEMLSSQRAWAGRSPVQILYARSQGERLRVPNACPPAFKVGAPPGAGQGPCAHAGTAYSWARAGWPKCSLL